VLKYEIINKAGSWFSYGDTKLGQVDSVKNNILADIQTLWMNWNKIMVLLNWQNS
jgi:hypothetical protein